MILKVFNLLLLFLVTSHTVWSKKINLLETKYLDVPLDHLEAASDITTFKLRYLINLKFYENGGPIFAYTGGNHDITNYAENNGFLFDCAVTFKGAVLFIEHRYYGQSLPFGNQSFSKNNLKYLSTSQAIADFSYVIIKVKKQLTKDSDNIPAPSHVFVFGGNYAGMMAAYLHMKYPHVAQGAIVSSPGLLRFPNLLSCDGVYKRVTSVYEEHGTKRCVEFIQLGWKVIYNLSKSKTGRNFLASTLNLCHKLTTPEDIDQLIEWISDIYTSITVVNYNSPSTYLAPVPAYPVKAVCEKFSTGNFNDSKSFIETLASVLGIYTNYLGEEKCNNIYPTNSDLNEIAFTYQSCTELITPRCSTDEDMFVNKPWNITQYLNDCYNRFEMRPVSSDWGTLMYGGNDFRGYKYLIISSNPKDPMSYETPDAKNSLNMKNSVIFHSFNDSSSMADLRGSNSADNNYLVRTRNFYINTMKKWMKMH